MCDFYLQEDYLVVAIIKYHQNNRESYEMKSIISKNANTFYFFGMSFIIRKNKLSGFANTNKRVPIAVAMAIRSLFSL